MVAMLSPLLNPATPERRAAHFLCKANRLRGVAKFRRCKTSFDQNTQRTAVLKTFLNLLSEMGQQNGNIACVLAPRSRTICAAREIFFIKRRLVRVARLLCCAHLDAAMHNRQSDSLVNSIRFWNRTGAASNRCNRGTFTVVLNNIVR